jgi:thiol-disulfide isomerase/thioredoxin
MKLAEHQSAGFALRMRHVAAMGCLLLSLAACNQPAPVVQPLVEGRAFPSSVLEFIARGSDSPQSLQGKVLVLNIWATWCPPCRREMPSLDRLSKILDPNHFAVIGLSTDADAILASEFLMQNGISFANFFDRNGKEARQLGMKVYPETFVIGPDRTLLRRMTGLHDWSSPEMVSLLEGLYQAQLGKSTELPNVPN